MPPSRIAAVVLIIAASGVAASPLHDAVVNNNASEVKQLLSAGLLRFRVEPDGEEQTTQNGVRVDEADDDGFTPLLVAAMLGHHEPLKLLAASGANLDARSNEGGMAPLHWVASRGHAEAAAALLEAGAGLDARDDGQRTPLHYAALRGHADVLQLFVDSSGADLEAQSERGTTPLQMAAERGELAACAALLAAGAKVEAAGDELQLRPLHAAAAMGHADVVEALLAVGADPDAKDARGRTPLALARAMKQRGAAKALRAVQPGWRANVGAWWARKRGRRS